MLRLLRATALTATCLVGGLAAGAWTALHAYAQGRNPYAKLDTLARVLTNVELHWVEQVAPDLLVEHAIAGMVDALDDHSIYLDPQTWARVQAGNEDGLDSLGLELGVESGRKQDIRVTGLVPAGPADRAGLSVGDLLVAVDRADVRGWPVADVVRLLDGEPGTPLRIEVLRGEARLVLTAVRDRVIAPAVEAALFAPGWGYARVLHFRHRVSSELARALDGLERESGTPLRGLVLDLRDNPGGVLEEAVGVTDLFVGEGLILETRARDEAERSARQATPSPGDRAMPLVVLVNGGSASASEIVAGALRDLGRATLVGSPTYGKGSVQSVYEFGDGSALKLTVARYYLAGGETIADHEGLKPDVLVTLEPPDTPETRLRAALAALEMDEGLREQMLSDIDALAALEQAPELTPVPWDGPLVERLERDRQLATAWRTLRGSGR